MDGSLRSVDCKGLILILKTNPRLIWFEAGTYTLAAEVPIHTATLKVPHI